MRLVQIGERNLMTTAIEEGLKRQGVDVYTYPPGGDALFFAHDLSAEVILVHDWPLEMKENLSKYPGLIDKHFLFVGSHENFARAQRHWPALLHINLPVAPLKLKAQIEEMVSAKH